MLPTDRQDQPRHENPVESHPVSLEDLLELVATGSPEPFHEVYDRTSAQIFGLASAVVRDLDSAEDVTREVFVEVWQLAGGFDRSVNSALDWMLLLTRSKSIECLHRRRIVRLRREQQMATSLKAVSAPELVRVVRQGSEFLMSFRPVTVGLPAAG